MLRAQRFPDILQSVLSDGVEGVVIMSAEGSILSSVSTDGEKSEFAGTAVAAVCSCIFANYQQSMQHIRVLHGYYQCQSMSL